MSADFIIHSAVRTHPGLKRGDKQNQDFVVFYEPVDKGNVLASDGRLYLVADGVGGASWGERASQYAAQKVLSDYYERTDIQDHGDRLAASMREAGNQIYEYSKKNQTRMATTMVTAAVVRGQLILANVGDSRAYLIRSGTARALTYDHTYAGEMLRNGMITEEQALRENNNQINRSIGGEQDVNVEVYTPERLQQKDTILLCSDGLTRYALSQDIADLVTDGSPTQIAERCIKFAIDNGGDDNIAVAVIQVGPWVDDIEAAPHLLPAPAMAPSRPNIDNMKTMSQEEMDAIYSYASDPREKTEKKERKLPSWLPVKWLPFIFVTVALLTLGALAILAYMLLIASPDASSENQGNPVDSPTPTPIVIVATPTFLDVAEPIQSPEVIEPEDQSFLITEDLQCVFEVPTDNTHTIQSIIEQFTDEPAVLHRNEVTTINGSAWSGIWPYGWDQGTLPATAQVVITFVQTFEECEAGGGEVKPKTSSRVIPAGGNTATANTLIEAAGTDPPVTPEATVEPTAETPDEPTEGQTEEPTDEPTEEPTTESPPET